MGKEFYNAYRAKSFSGRPSPQHSVRWQNFQNHKSMEPLPSLSGSTCILVYFTIHQSDQFEIILKVPVERSGRELFKSFEGKIFRVIVSTYFTSTRKVIRRKVCHKNLNKCYRLFRKKTVRHLRCETTYSTKFQFLIFFSSGDWFPLCQATQGEAISTKTRLVPITKTKPRNFLTSSSNPARSQTELNLISPAEAKSRVGVIYPPTQFHSPGDEGNESTGLSSFRTSDIFTNFCYYKPINS